MSIIASQLYKFLQCSYFSFLNLFEFIKREVTNIRASRKSEFKGNLKVINQVKILMYIKVDEIYSQSN